MTYIVKYKNGLQNDWIVDASNENEAKLKGLAHHRENCGFVETVDRLPVSMVVDSVLPIEIT